MSKFKERYVIDEKGNRVGVLVNIEDYYLLLEELEQLESIRAYDATITSNDEVISFEQAIAEIEQNRG